MNQLHQDFLATYEDLYNSNSVVQAAFPILTQNGSYANNSSITRTFSFMEKAINVLYHNTNDPYEAIYDAIVPDTLIRASAKSLLNEVTVANNLDNQTYSALVQLSDDHDRLVDELERISGNNVHAGTNHGFSRPGNQSVQGASSMYNLKGINAGQHTSDNNNVRVRRVQPIDTNKLSSRASGQKTLDVNSKVTGTRANNRAVSTVKEWRNIGNIGLAMSNKNFDPTVYSRVTAKVLGGNTSIETPNISNVLTTLIKNIGKEVNSENYGIDITLTDIIEKTVLTTPVAYNVPLINSLNVAIYIATKDLKKTTSIDPATTVLKIETTVARPLITMGNSELDQYLMKSKISKYINATTLDELVKSIHDLSTRIDNPDDYEIYRAVSKHFDDICNEEFSKQLKTIVVQPEIYKRWDEFKKSVIGYIVKHSNISQDEAEQRVKMFFEKIFINFKRKLPDIDRLSEMSKEDSETIINLCMLDDDTDALIALEKYTLYSIPLPINMLEVMVPDESTFAISSIDTPVTFGKISPMYNLLESKDDSEHKKLAIKFTGTDMVYCVTKIVKDEESFFIFKSIH